MRIGERRARLRMDIPTNDAAHGKNNRVHGNLRYALRNAEFGKPLCEVDRLEVCKLDMERPDSLRRRVYTAFARGCVSARSWPHAAAISRPIGIRTVHATPLASRIAE